MPKFLLQASYTAQGLKGLMKGGGSQRRKAVQELMAGVGGNLEALYFAFGTDDVVAIVEAPDNAACAAACIAAGASGMVQPRTTVLLTPEEVDEATQKSVSYTPPGG